MQFDAEQRLWLAGECGPLTMMKDGEYTKIAETLSCKEAGQTTAVAGITESTSASSLYDL